MKKLLLLIFIINSFNTLYGSAIKDRTEESIRAAIGGDVELELRKYTIPKEIKVQIQNTSKQAFFRNEVYIWKIIKDHSTVGYAILDNVIGKTLPITFLVIFDLDNNIIASEIIKYREPIGGAIQNKKWNDQFIGKNYNSLFSVGQDVDGITGATISVNSVSKGINKLARLINQIGDDL